MVTGIGDMIAALSRVHWTAIDRRRLRRRSATVDGASRRSTGITAPLENPDLDSHPPTVD